MSDIHEHTCQIRICFIINIYIYILFYIFIFIVIYVIDKVGCGFYQDHLFYCVTFSFGTVVLFPLLFHCSRHYPPALVIFWIEFCMWGWNQVQRYRLWLLVPLRLAIRVLLSSDWETICAFFAVVCSSWVPVNRGSTQRTIMTPLGNEQFPQVRKSNKLTARRMFVSVWFSLYKGVLWYVSIPC